MIDAAFRIRPFLYLPARPLFLRTSVKNPLFSVLNTAFQGFSAFLAASAGLLRQRAVMRAVSDPVRKTTLLRRVQKTVCVNY
jgi:hypothetical protein